MTIINISKDFSTSPGGRFPDDGEYNGERFREEILVPALRGNQTVKIVLDGISGFGSSFLEEAFGGLVRIHRMTSDDLLKRIEIFYSDPSLVFYADSIRDFISDAQPE